jgi:cytochrome bd-type quinol oxidase subunit 2
VVVLGEGSLARQLFMNFVWLVGTYLFAAVLGVITGDIMERIQVRCTEPRSLLRRLSPFSALLNPWTLLSLCSIRQQLWRRLGPVDKCHIV